MTRGEWGMMAICIGIMIVVAAVAITGHDLRTVITKNFVPIFCGAALAVSAAFGLAREGHKKKTAT